MAAILLVALPNTESIMRLPVILILCVFAANQAAYAQPIKPQKPFPLIGNDDAWNMLPRENPALPPWARVLVGPLPKTTAKMLELEYLHRAKNPLGAELAGLIQWTVADTLGSKFGKATAEADLRRAGVPAKYLADIGNNPGLAPEVRVAVSF